MQSQRIDELGESSSVKMFEVNTMLTLIGERRLLLSASGLLRSIK